MGSAKWQFSVIAGSDAEIYQFSRSTFLEKFPLHCLNILKNGCQDTFNCMYFQLESSLRCCLKAGWTPNDFHPLIDCKKLYIDRNNSVLEIFHTLLDECIVQLMIRRQKNQQTFS